MTVTDKTEPSQTDAVSFVFDLPHSRQKVWRALTDPVLLSQWLLPIVELELAPGASFKFTFEAAQLKPGGDGIVNCRVLEIEEHEKLRYSWDSPPLSTVVTFTLSPTPSGTRLSLVQSGFKPDEKHNFGGARYGWKNMGEKLVDLLARLP